MRDLFCIYLLGCHSKGKMPKHPLNFELVAMTPSEFFYWPILPKLNTPTKSILQLISH